MEARLLLNMPRIWLVSPAVPSAAYTGCRLSRGAISRIQLPTFRRMCCVRFGGKLGVSKSAKRDIGQAVLLAIGQLKHREMGWVVSHLPVADVRVKVGL
jgi:hypothetical protein